MALLTLSSAGLRAQFPGERSRGPFAARDGYSYRVGDGIRLGYPSKGRDFLTVFIYKYENSLETGTKILGALSGRNVADSPKPEPAKSDASQYEGKILFFKTVNNDAGRITYAITDYKPGYRLAIAVDLSLVTGELQSLNPEYARQRAEKPAASGPVVKSFSPAYDFKFLSVTGSREDQTVLVTLLLTHHLVHQKVCLWADEYSKIYDGSGNEYAASKVSNGSAQSGYVQCNKIPTDIPVKITYEFNRILPTVKQMTYMISRLSYGDYDHVTGYGTYGSLEVSGMPEIEWK